MWPFGQYLPCTRARWVHFEALTDTGQAKLQFPYGAFGASTCSHTLSYLLLPSSYLPPTFLLPFSCFLLQLPLFGCVVSSGCIRLQWSFMGTPAHGIVVGCDGDMLAILTRLEDVFHVSMWRFVIVRFACSRAISCPQLSGEYCLSEVNAGRAD